MIQGLANLRLSGYTILIGSSNLQSSDSVNQLEFFEIPSPCIGVCQSGKSGYCLGCYRSRDERLYWVQLTPDVKRKIIKACQRRKKQANKPSSDKHDQKEQQQASLFNDLD